MTPLVKPVKRVTSAHRHERSKTRRVILIMEPPATIGVRLEGTRETYRLEAETIYQLAVRAHIEEVEREARRLMKADKLPRGRARSLARKNLKGRLK